MPNPSDTDIAPWCDDISTMPMLKWVEVRFVDDDGVETISRDLGLAFIPESIDAWRPATDQATQPTASTLTAYVFRDLWGDRFLVVLAASEDAARAAFVRKREQDGQRADPSDLELLATEQVGPEVIADIDATW